jgi:hypothetical protein
MDIEYVELVKRAETAQHSKVYNAAGWSNSWLSVAEKSGRLCGGVEWHRVNTIKLHGAVQHSGVQCSLVRHVKRQRQCDTPSSLGTRFTWGDSFARSACPKRCREGVSNFFMQNDT